MAGHERLADAKPLAQHLVFLHGIFFGFTKRYGHWD